MTAASCGSERHFFIEALLEFVGRLIFTTRIAAQGGAAEERAIDFTDTTRSWLGIDLFQGKRLLWGFFPGEEASEEGAQQSFELVPEEVP